MDVNKYRILLPKNDDKEIVIPIEMTWDFLDRSDSLIPYENKVTEEILNQRKDFEIVRFNYYGQNTSTGWATDINYRFNFVPTGATVTTATWLPSYVIQGFTPAEIYYYSKPFTQSFFKLDFYDSSDTKKQKLCFTTIIPTQQGLTTPTTIGFQTKDIKTPIFKLDYLGDKEGFFLYWLKNREVLNVTSLFMSAKFFDAKTGVFIKMMTRPQSSIVGNKFTFPQEDYFYYRVDLDYVNFTYTVYDYSSGYDIFVGPTANPINWYEYINP